MGAWGYGNFENDDALDWADDFRDFLVRSIKSKFHNKNLAAIYLLASISFDVEDTSALFPNFEVIDLAYNRLETILKNDGWLFEWNDKEQKIKEINNLKIKLNEIRNKLLSRKIAS